jgi:hypothetical protein
LAGILSVVPGLGNIYNGLYQRGVTFFLIVIGLFSISVHHDDETLALLIPSMGFFWLFNIFDAYRQATLMNYGYSEPAIPSGSPRNASGALVLGVSVFLVGLYGLLRKVFDFDFAVILEYWHLGFLAFGSWLIYQAIQQKNASTDQEDSISTDPKNNDEDEDEDVSGTTEAT